MKKMKLIDGTVFELLDDEAENVCQQINTSKFVRLRNGQLVNVSSISYITETSNSPFWRGFPVLEGNFPPEGKRSYILENGKRKFLTNAEQAEIVKGLPDEALKIGVGLQA